VRLGGQPSHARVLTGIELLRKHGVEFNILVLVSDRNVRSASQVYRYLCDRGFLFHQYIPCVEFEPDGRLKPFSITGEQWGEFLCEIYDTWHAGDTRRVSIRHHDSLIAWFVDRAQTVCTIGRDCRHYFVVEHNGDIYPCDFFVDPVLRIGNVADTPWSDALESDIYRRFGQRKAQHATACSECRFLELCAGDCLKHRCGGQSQMSVLCEGWKKFYAHALPGLEELASQARAERAFGRAAPPGRARRNERCPCGSGHKYKHCCMGRRTATAGGVPT
jgi:uncharacterized protein